MTYIPMIDTSTGEIDAGLVAERNWEASLRSQELKNIRKRLGMDRLPFARMIGYTGTDRNDVMRVKQYEEKKQVPLYIARLVWLIVEYKRATGKFPTFPDWPGYQFAHEPDVPQGKKDHEFY